MILALLYCLLIVAVVVGFVYLAWFLLGLALCVLMRDTGKQLGLDDDEIKLSIKRYIKSTKWM